MPKHFTFWKKKVGEKQSTNSRMFPLTEVHLEKVPM